MTSYPTDAPQAPADTPEEVLSRAQAMVQLTPQAHALGIAVTAIENGRVHGRVPYRQDLVGDPDTGVIAGGVLTTLLDQIAGTAAVVAMKEPTAVATIDLRIDYMRPAEPGRDIIAEAHCIKLTRSVAFVRAVAFEDSAENPVAHAAAAFMITGARK
ncbi:MAG: PaaI family thioesterase [Hyphomonadaceae bacterium]